MEWQKHEFDGCPGNVFTLQISSRDGTKRRRQTGARRMMPGAAGSQKYTDGIEAYCRCATAHQQRQPA
jgi:hypothetical protein